MSKTKKIRHIMGDFPSSGGTDVQPTLLDFDVASSEGMVGNLHRLWMAIVGLQDTTTEDERRIVEVIKQIANAPSEQAFRKTDRAIRFAQLIDEFQSAKPNEATKLMEDAKQWYDYMEGVFSRIVDALQRGEWAVGAGNNESLRGRRLVGISTMLGITSPMVKVPHNLVMTMVGALAVETQLKEMLEKYQQTDQKLTFDKMVEKVVNNKETLREFLSGVEEKIFGVAKGEPKPTAFRIGEEPVVLPKYTEPKATAVFTGKGKTLQVTFNRMMGSNMLRGVLAYLDALSREELGKPLTLFQKWSAKEFFEYYSQLVGQLKEPDVPQTEKAMLGTFLRREKELRFGRTKPEEGMLVAPLTTESKPFSKALREVIIANFGETATKTKSFAVSAFFSAVAEKMGIGSSLLPSVVFDTWMNANLHNMLREIDERSPSLPRLQKLNNTLRLSLLPYGLDMKATQDNEGNLTVYVKDYLEGKAYIKRGRSLKVASLQDAVGKPEFGDFVSSTDALVHQKLQGKAKALPIYRDIANAMKERRVYMYSPTSELTPRTDLLKDVKVGAYGRGEADQPPPERVRWKGGGKAKGSEVGRLVVREVEKLFQHMLTTGYDSDGNVFFVKGNPFFERIAQSAQSDVKQRLIKKVVFNDTVTDAVFAKDVIDADDVVFADNGRLVAVMKQPKEKTQTPKKEETVVMETAPSSFTKSLPSEYKEYMDSFRRGGTISLLSEQVMKNALYYPEPPEKAGRLDIRALQALVWVCTRGAL